MMNYVDPLLQHIPFRRLRDEVVHRSLQPEWGGVAWDRGVAAFRKPVGPRFLLPQLVGDSWWLMVI